MNSCTCTPIRGIHHRDCWSLKPPVEPVPAATIYAQSMVIDHERLMDFEQRREAERMSLKTLKITNAVTEASQASGYNVNAIQHLFLVELLKRLL